MLLRILLYITLLFLSLGTSWSQSSNINKLEYFFNTDPGVGQGANIPVTPGTSVSTSLSIPTTGLAAGFHRLYLRARYDNGRWGMAEARAFYLYQPPLVSTPDIDKLEYFFNTDPGVGNGTPIPINAGTSVSTALVIPTNSLGTGFHRLYVRARYVDGRWGLVEGRTFYLYQPPLVSTPNIDKLEYFFNTDPGVGNGTPIPINAGTSVSTALVIPTTGLATGFHRL
ncbi:MAG: hypothetical protein ABIQ93_09015, partial [Saprospiraceae bacterium]